LAFQDIILLIKRFYQFIDFLFLFNGVVCKERRQISSFSLELPSSSKVVYLGVSLEHTIFFFPSLGMRHLWSTLGKMTPLLMVMLATSLLEALSDKSHLHVLKFGGINWEPFGWRGLVLFFCCLECNRLCLGCGYVALLQVSCGHKTQVKASRPLDGFSD
jgi:hypothetical protein